MTEVLGLIAVAVLVCAGVCIWRASAQSVRETRRLAEVCNVTAESQGDIAAALAEIADRMDRIPNTNRVVVPVLLRMNAPATSDDAVVQNALAVAGAMLQLTQRIQAGRIDDDIVTDDIRAVLGPVLGNRASDADPMNIDMATQLVRELCRHTLNALETA